MELGIMMEFLGAYSLNSLEMRILTYNYQVSPTMHVDIDDACMETFNHCVDDWLALDYGFHSCTRHFDDELQVTFFC